MLLSIFDRLMLKIEGTREGGGMSLKFQSSLEINHNFYGKLSSELSIM